MSLPHTLSFPDYDPVTGPPTIDGWTGNEDFGVTTTLAEPGFAVGDRLTFSGGSAFAPAVIQTESVVNPAGLPGGRYLGLSFFCGLDLSFDQEDVIVVALQDPGIAGRAGYRRIDIFPNETDFGAGTGAEPGETVLPGTPPGNDYHVRLGKQPFGYTLWKGHDPDAANPALWTPLAADVPVQVKACSWRPAVPDVTTVSAGRTLPAPGTSFSLTVANGSTFNAAGGLLQVTATDTGGNPYLAIVTYTSRVGNTFNGCTTPGQGTIAAGAGVRYPDVGWSVELLLPTNSLGEVDPPWISVGASFPLYINIVRWGTTAATGNPNHPFEGSYATQFAFPVLDPASPQFLTGSVDDSLVIPTWGTGLIPSLESPVGSNLGIGVQFHTPLSPDQSVGVRHADAPGTALGDTIEGPTSTQDNWLVAIVDNTDTTDATHVSAEFRFANWGLPAATFPAWAPAPGATDFHQNITIPHGGSTELVSKWNHGDVPFPPDPGTTTKHLCMWVRLNSPDAVNFVQGAVRRNMNFEHLSTLDRQAEVSGTGYPAPSGGKHDFLIVPHLRRIDPAPAPPPPPGDINVRTIRAAAAEGDPGVTFFWIMEGLRLADETITVNKKTARIADPAPGHFALVLTHDTAGDVLTHRLTGAGISGGPGAVYQLTVPHDGTVQVGVHLDASPPKPGDGGQPGGKGCLAHVVAVLLAIVAAIRKLLKK